MTIEPTFNEWRSESNHTLDLNPIRKFNWKTGGSRDYWEEKLGHFRHDVPIQYMPTVLADEEHPQDAAIFRIGEDMVMDIAMNFGSKGLAFSQVSINGQGGTTIFNDYPNIIDRGGKNKKNLIIGQDEEMINDLSHIVTDPELTEEQYRKAADAFGWPDCCTDFHLEHALNNMSDPVYEIACNTPSVDPYEDDRENAIAHFPDPLLNIVWRYMGWRFINHPPCSFECEHSSVIARKNHDAMVENGFEDEAEALIEWLDLPFTWSGYHGLVNIRNAYSIGSYNTNDYWSEKQLIWQRPHEVKSDFEPNHNTTELEPIDPDASQV